MPADRLENAPHAEVNVPPAGPGYKLLRRAIDHRAGRWVPWLPRVLGGLFLVALGLAAGLLAARYGLAVPLGILAGLALAVCAFLSPWAGLLAGTGIAILLPFGVLPVRFGLTPSFLELALLGALGGWLLSPLVRGEQRWHFSILDTLAWTFMALTLLSLLVGLGRGVNATVLHNYGKTTLGMLAFFGIRQVVRDRERVRQFVALVLLAAALAAILGLFLYALPDATALDLLKRLQVVGYPAEGRVLRYVEDDPSGLERAIGTSVDPNSFGGMLTLAAAVALAEALASFRAQHSDRPPLPRPVLLAILTALAACLYLTYSRAALGGLVAAAIFLAGLRYRRLWWAILAVAVVLALLAAGMGGNNPVAERFRQGLAFEDLANRMRLAEFANALDIIRRYPVFGVGFGDAPDIELSTGVSSLYLTIAERMGLVGLLSFLAFLAVALAQALGSARPHVAPMEHRLALWAGVAAALAMGLLDHYYFNLEFPHMAALLWMTLGAATATSADPRWLPT